MSTRYGILLKRDDGREEVSDIKLLEGSEPVVPDNGLYSVEKNLDNGVKIGMVRGGSRDAVGGFGYEDFGVEETPETPKKARRAKSTDKSTDKSGKAEKASFTEETGGKVTSTAEQNDKA